MYQFKPIPSTIQVKIDFPSKSMRQLGRNELSAIFIIFIECLLTTNNQRKIETFYQIEIKNKQNFAFRYQQFLKKTFNIKEQITFKIFLELQKIQDPQNVQSGEFLKAHYYDKTNKQISISSVIKYLYKTFNVYIAIASSQHLSTGKTQIPKDCYAILLQDLDNQYSIIKEQQPPEQFGCQFCSSKSPYFIQDGAKHKYCLDCLQKLIGYGQNSKFYYTCKLCYQDIMKVDVKNLEQTKQYDIQQKNFKAANQQLAQYQNQTKRQAQKQCSYCQYQFLDQSYYQNTCNHIFCQKCVECQVKFKTCIIDNCNTRVNYESILYFQKTNKFEIQKQEQGSNQNYANQQNQQNLVNQVPLYQGNQQLQSICSRCHNQFADQQYYQNSCNHILCSQCVDIQISKSTTCLIDNCRVKVDFDSLQSFQNYNKSMSFVDEQKPQINILGQLCNKDSNIYQQQENIQQPINEEHNNCVDCQKKFKVDKLFTNYCGKCVSKDSSNIYQVSSNDFECKQQIEINQQNQFLIDQKTVQSKKPYDKCIVCAQKLTLSQLFQNQCNHNICFDCINNAFNKQYDWLEIGECPDMQCLFRINIEQLEEFFLIKQQEKIQENELQ